MADTWPSLGILFDIDEIRGDNEEPIFDYGYPVRKIFMKYFDPAAAGQAFLWHGETQATLNGNERFWCIAISFADPARMEIVRKAFSAATDRGLPPLNRRFRGRPVDVDFRSGRPVPIQKEPLMLWLSVNERGTIVIADPTAEDVYLCRTFGRKFRLPTLLQERLERIQNGTASPESVAPEGTDQDDCIIEAVDLDLPGVPANLLKYVEHSRKHGPTWTFKLTITKLEEILQWPRERILARSDRSDIERALVVLGSFFQEKQIFRGVTASYSKLAECLEEGSPRHLDALAQQAEGLVGEGKRDEARSLAMRILGRRPDHAIARKVADITQG